MKERGVTMANGLLQLHIDDILPNEDYTDMTLEEINAEIAAVRDGK